VQAVSERRALRTLSGPHHAVSRTRTGCRSLHWITGSSIRHCTPKRDRIGHTGKDNVTDDFDFWVCRRRRMMLASESLTARLSKGGLPHRSARLESFRGRTEIVWPRYRR
jgi:hypothetical protein